MPLSVVLITQNAAAQLPECLASVAFADEVVVVDSGSSDGTAEVAARYGARVVKKEWLGFGRQKQFAVAQAAHGPLKKRPGRAEVENNSIRAAFSLLDEVLPEISNLLSRAYFTHAFARRA